MLPQGNQVSVIVAVEDALYVLDPFEPKLQVTDSLCTSPPDCLCVVYLFVCCFHTVYLFMCCLHVVYLYVCYFPVVYMLFYLAYGVQEGPSTLLGRGGRVHLWQGSGTSGQRRQCVGRINRLQGLPPFTCCVWGYV